MPAAKYVMTGLVQGVGFRAAVSRCANSLGLGGYVRNNADGSVTALAQGPAEKLALFESMLKEGCGSFARVERVERFAAEETPGLEGFQVR